jgi:hypothetical protein
MVILNAPTTVRFEMLNNNSIESLASESCTNNLVIVQILNAVVSRGLLNIAGLFMKVVP